ncbi:MAG: hypothetical protein LC785_06945 [Acidobacteria bacterium]|nr:hypothetical protein [Acidobacteriota bacterium]MCA1641673.1 hypothetical protein [Acidobacteriota bacterium]
MENIFEIASKISTPLALSGLFAAILFFICRQIIAKNIFPSLTRTAGRKVIIIIITGLFGLALLAMVLGFIGFLVTQLKGETKNITQPLSNTDVEYAGQVIDDDGNPINGAIVQIRDERGNIQEKRTDSVGGYQYVMSPSSNSACINVSATNYEKKERCLPPSQTGREPFVLQRSQTIVLQRSQTKPTPTPRPKPPPIDRKEEIRKTMRKTDPPM